MKKLAQFFAICLLIISFANCRKVVKPKEEISHTQIDKVFSLETMDSISIGGDHYFINIITDSLTQESCIQIAETEYSMMLIGNGGLLFLGSEDEIIKLLNYGSIISSNEKWGTLPVQKFYTIKGLKGGEEQYIGLKTTSAPIPETKTFFGWMRIKFDDETKSLQVIDLATHDIENHSIKAGQLE